MTEITFTPVVVDMPYFQSDIDKAIKELEAYNLRQYLLKWIKENETT